MENITGILEKAGLSKNEANVYLALLNLSLTSAKPLIDKLKMHRQIVYDSISSLIEMGLVSFVVQANRKYFKASSPKQILALFDKKEEEINTQKEEFRRILSELELKQVSKEQQEATLYYGNKGIKSLLDDMLNENKEILTIGSSDIDADAFKYHLEFNLPKFHTFRESKKINYRIILGEEMKERASELSKLKHTEAKILPKEFTSNSSTNIYSDKISIILWGSQPFGILVRSKEIADSQRKHFELLWKLAKMV